MISSARVSSTHLIGGATHRLSRAIAGLGVAFILVSSANAAGNVERFACHRLSGGSFVPAITLTFDYTAKSVTTAPDEWFEPVPDATDVTDTKFEWGFMRGYAVFDRKTYVLDWDATAEYDYLDTIGHTPKESRDIFKGRMQCKAAP